MSNLEVGMRLTAHDQATPVLARAAAAARQSAERTSRTTTQLIQRATSEQTSLHQRAAQAREQLGIRSENAIRREIQLTEAAYNRLAKRGTQSAQEQARAFEAMTTKVKALRAEMGHVERQQMGMAQRVKGTANTALGIGAGVATAGYMLRQPMMDERQYDTALRYTTNTVFDERKTLQGREAGKEEIKLLVRKATAQGGTRDDALAALDSLMGSGALGDNSAVAMRSAQQMLPTIMKYSTAANADPREIAEIVIKAKQSQGISDAELPRLLDMAMMGGKLGGFELKNMAKWLPQQMAAAKMAGVSGPEGLAKLIALNQKAVLVAGSRDEAGNNVVNFLAKLNTPETAKDMKKLGVKDWTGLLMSRREKGQDAVEVFGEVIDKQMEKDKRYQSLRQKAEKAKSGSKEQQDLIAQMTDIVMGSVVGKIQTDRQEMMGSIAYLTDRKGTADIQRKVMGVKAGGVVDLDLAFIQQGAGWKNQQGDNAIQAASNDFFAGPNAWWGDRKKDFADWASGNRDTAANVVGSGTLAQAGGSSLLLSRYLLGGSERGLFNRALNQLPTRAGLLRTSVGALPLAAMAGVTAWAGDTSHDKQRTENLLGVSKWLDGFMGKQAEFDARRNAQLEALGRKLEQPIPVEVSVRVENGNVVASVNKVNQIMAGRY